MQIAKNLSTIFSVYLHTGVNTLSFILLIEKKIDVDDKRQIVLS